MSRADVPLGPVTLGRERPPIIVAELSGNHGGELGRALELVDAAADAGAHAVKLQTYTPDTMTLEHDGDAFRIGEGHELWGSRRLHDLYAEAQTPWDWHAPLFERARERGLLAFSSPFDATAVELLEGLGATVYKVASLEIGDIPLLESIGRTGKPVIVSNGAASVSDVEQAIRTLRGAGSGDVVLLSCTSSYPASPSESNLRSIPVLADLFDVHVGLSDHTPGIGAAVAAIALGARIVEKHLTLSRADGGVDAAFSLEPAELASLVVESGRGFEALGSATPSVTAGEGASVALRRSLWLAEDVEEGDVVTAQNVRSLRPAGGLAPAELPRVLGRRFTRDVERGTPLSWELV